MLRSICERFGLRHSSAVACSVLLCGGLICSCDFFEQPPPFVNAGAAPTQVRTDARTSLPPGASETGGFFVTFFPDEPLSQIQRAQLFLDTTLVTVTTATPNEYFIDTKGFGGGSHVLTLNVFDVNPGQGLLNPFHYPSSVYTTSIVLASGPEPPQPQNVVLHWIYLSHPRITWEYPAGGDTLADHFVVARLFPRRFTDTLLLFSFSYVDSSQVCIPESLQEYAIGAGNAFGVNYALQESRTIGQ